MTRPTCAHERTADAALVVRLAGDWRMVKELPKADEVVAEIDSRVQRVVLDGREVGEWDTNFLAFVLPIVRAGNDRGIDADCSDLPEGVRRLLDLAFAVPEKETHEPPPTLGPVGRVGEQMLALTRGTRDMLTFLGEATLSFGRLVTGRARFRGRDLLLAIQEAGVEALGIVSLISFLVGLILAFMGAMQLEVFGAEIYVADLVAIGAAREMAPLMTGIIMAGRTGAAYAAQLGTMTVNEEIDSLRALGLSPMDFLVLPRMLALMVMMPLLTIYANLLAILGGFVVGTGLLGITRPLYWSQTIEAVGLDDFAVGIFKASVLGVLIAIAGCMRGMQCGRSASAVGLATTSAVVTGIVAIVISEATFAVVFQVLGI